MSSALDRYSLSLSTMFGFLRSSRDHRVWRQAYARCCQGLRRDYGLRVVPWLSYEAVALYLAAMDVRAVPPPGEAWPTCCRLRSIPRRAAAPDRAVVRYCSAAGVLLAGIKMEDDLRDDPTLAARMRARMLRGSVRRAEAELNAISPGLVERLRGEVTRHIAMEASRELVTLDAIVAPTSRAFGLLFEGVAGCCPSPTDEDRAALRRLGERLGSAIIRFDCAVDRERDARRGEFNPLRSAEEGEDSYDAALEDLHDAGTAWRMHVGSRSEIATLLERRIETLLRRSLPSTSNRGAIAEQCQLRRDRRSVYAHMNVCAVFECLECCVGFADCMTCCAPSRSHGCDCGTSTGCGCAFCDDLSSSSSTKTADDPEEPFIGRKGKCITALAPRGMIRIGGVRRRAETNGETLAKGTRVIVIAAESNGLIVKRADKEE